MTHHRSFTTETPAVAKAMAGVSVVRNFAEGACFES
jgi:hypothetical protein